MSSGNTSRLLTAWSSPTIKLQHDISEYRYFPGSTDTFGLDYTSRPASLLCVDGHNEGHEAVLVEADKWDRKVEPYRTLDPTSLFWKRWRKIQLTSWLPPSLGGRHMAPRYVMCKAERSYGFPKSPPGYCEVWGHEDDSAISHTKAREQMRTMHRKHRRGRGVEGAQHQGSLRWASGDHYDALTKPRDAKA